MPCEIVEKKEGLITVKLSGLLKRAEIARAENAAIALLETAHKMRIFIIIENFQGWDNKDNWEDVSFQSRYDAQIEKIAIVGEKRWQEPAVIFAGQGLRSVDIRYFAPSEIAAARAWIA
jgi:hypothetical protein